MIEGIFLIILGVIMLHKLLTLDFPPNINDGVCHIYKITLDGKEYLINNKGGVVEHKPQEK